MLIDDGLLGDKSIKLRDKNAMTWTRIEHVIKDFHGNVLYLIDMDNVVYPWHAIDKITPLGR
jgi:hypothetical protein